jgi:hypothetical protein
LFEPAPEILGGAALNRGPDFTVDEASAELAAGRFVRGSLSMPFKAA